MAVLTALRRTPRALVDNPVLFVPPLALALLQVPGIVLRSISPLVASVFSLVLSAVYLFVVPFFQGGVLGMASEALEGTTSLSTFVAAGKANYVPLFAVYLLIVLVNAALGAIAFVVAVVGGVAVFATGSSQANVGLLAAIAVIVGLGALVYLLVMLFVQFYGHAIVLDDRGPIGGLKRSVSLVRSHLLSVAGYTLLLVLIGGGAGVVIGVSSAATSPQALTLLPSFPGPPILISVVAAVVTIVASTLLGGVLAVFTVAFYRTLT